MNQITNSTLKEQIRQRNENEARNQESQIQIQLTNDINNLTPRKKYEVTGWLIGGAVLALITGRGNIPVIISTGVLARVRHGIGWGCDR